MRLFLLGSIMLGAAAAVSACRTDDASGVVDPESIPRVAATPGQQPRPLRDEWECGVNVQGDVDTLGATPLGANGFTANGCVQPHGEAASYYFEYGPTAEYGSRTPSTDVPPRLAAFYRESWDDALNGWKGGMSGQDLVHTREQSGFARFAMPSGVDANHSDGIGYLELAQYFYVGTYVDEVSTSSLGGGDPDFRDARVAVSVRGNAFDPVGSELLFWAQADSDLAQQNDENWRRANWAHTGFILTDAALAGGWQRVEYRLENDSRAWSYSGQSVDQQRPNYRYAPIHEVLAHLNCDIFHLLSFVNLAYPPAGTIDFDDIEIAYRNHSLVFSSNGGRLVSAPAGSTDAARLTDGWRSGANHTWQSAPNPSGPLEIVYDFAKPVDIEVVQIHQDPEFPSRDVEVLVSADGSTWTSIAGGTIPERSALGPNFAHFLKRGITGARASMAKVRVLSGYRADRWGLGEIEMFGRGAVKSTDDAWHHVNLNVTGLEAGRTYHYRLVEETTSKTALGIDRTFTVPADRQPVVRTGNAARLGRGTGRLDGTLTAMGKYTEYRFEYGLDTTYGMVTAKDYGGQEETPRMVVAALTNLLPGTVYHYRLVAWNAEGATYGDDASFITP